MDGRVLGEWALERWPASLEPSLGSVGLWVWVLGGVAQEGPVKREDASALGDEVSPEPIVGFSFVRNAYDGGLARVASERGGCLTSWDSRLPPHGLLDTGTQDG